MDTSQASGSTTEAPLKRPCGRPKGSKNKAKNVFPVQVGPSPPSMGSNDVTFLGTAHTEAGTMRTETENSIANMAMRPNVSLPEAVPRDVDVQTTPSALGGNAPEGHNLGAHTVSSARTPQPPSATLITDVENENDFTSFGSGSGIGEENDEEGDVDPNKHFPSLIGFKTESRHSDELRSDLQAADRRQ
ncbi:hypothetical protein B0H11DRAFT_1914405 [Mycena galericulata]|nr:hypothetical protein B0H11DRAFT_1914405 [Mycena galericulata]